MKNLLLVLLTLTASNAFASKARLASLQSADHVVDTQTVFTNPSDLSLLTPFMTYEMGAVGAGAEGGFSRKLANGNMLGVYLGHDNTTDLRDGTTYLKQQNPIEVIYSMGAMGFSGSFSTVDNKKSGTKETTLVGKFGARNGDVAYYAHLTAISTAEKTGTPDQKITASPGILVGGSKDVDTSHFFGSIELNNAKEEAAADVKTTDTDLILGWLDRSLKNADADIYYGAKIMIGTRDIEGDKISMTSLPVFMGIEYNLNTWAIFRGSVQQNFLIGSVKDGTAVNTDPDGINSNTTFSGGLGFKYNQLTLDGTLAASNSGAINGTAFLTTASVTYNF